MSDDAMSDDALTVAVRAVILAERKQRATSKALEAAKTADYAAQIRLTVAEQAVRKAVREASWREIEVAIAAARQHPPRAGRPSRLKIPSGEDDAI